MVNNLKLKDVWFKREKDTHIFSGISLALTLEDEVVLVLGPSGTGKSTLLYLLNGMLHPTHGLISVNGYILGKSASEEHLAKYRSNECTLLFQNYPLVSWLTAYENIELVTNDVSMLTYCMETLGVYGLADKYPSDMSFGQRQRIAVIQTILTDCNIVLMDEPTSALDTQNKFKVMDLIRKISTTTKKSVIIATHDLDLIQFADKAYTISNSKLKAMET